MVTLPISVNGTLDICYHCYQIILMPQLLVRDIDEALVYKLKRRAADHGVSAEEEHRRILREALSRPDTGKPSLIEFLTSPEAEIHPDTDLDLERSRTLEDRDTGL